LRNCERKTMTILDQNRYILRDSMGLPSKTVIEFRSAEIGVECMLPYFVLSRVRPHRGKMPARQWDFVLVSASLMVLFHPTLAALVPSLITGAFLAYCYAHFARRSAGKAILATTVFHGAINIVGWVMLMISIHS